MYRWSKKRKPKGEVAKKLDVRKLQGVSVTFGTTRALRPGSEVALAIKSLETTVHNTHKLESTKYTGTLVKGIATMHKSNAVPVIDEEQMKDISRMRRG